MVVEAMENEHPGVRAAMQEFGRNDHKTLARWERIYWKKGQKD